MNKRTVNFFDVYMEEKHPKTLINESRIVFRFMDVSFLLENDLSKLSNLKTMFTNKLLNRLLVRASKNLAKPIYWFIV